MEIQPKIVWLQRMVTVVDIFGFRPRAVTLPTLPKFSDQLMNLSPTSIAIEPVSMGFYTSLVVIVEKQ